ncbi:MAG TPA: hypothetical protein EYG85_08350 [Crocinitomix sp.]|nr:hypothetical protein [Crocinitomix sp.]
MKNFALILITFTLFSCDKSFKHQRFIQNNSFDTITVLNPDFDSLYYIFPQQEKMIYSFENLDSEQNSEPCKWLGDTLIIKTIHDSILKKPVSIESNWTSTITPLEDGRLQKCVFTIEIGDI